MANIERFENLAFAVTFCLMGFVTFVALPLA